MKYYSFVKRVFLVLFLTAGLLLFFILVGDKYFSSDEAIDIYKNINDYTNVYFVKSIFIFVGVYILTVFFSVPIKPILKMLAGLLFGLCSGFFLSLISATVGGVLSFMFIKYSWGTVSTNSKYKIVFRFKSMMKNHPVTILFLSRLLPIPFFIPNILAGILKVKNSIFFFTTLIGIIPITFIYVWIGTQIGQTLDGQDVNNFVDIKFILAISGLAILAIIPFIVKHKFFKN